MKSWTNDSMTVTTLVMFLMWQHQEKMLRIFLAHKWCGIYMPPWACMLTRERVRGTWRQVVGLACSHMLSKILDSILLFSVKLFNLSFSGLNNSIQYYLTLIAVSTVNINWFQINNEYKQIFNKWFYFIFVLNHLILQGKWVMKIQSSAWR